MLNAQELHSQPSSRMLVAIFSSVMQGHIYLHNGESLSFRSNYTSSSVLSSPTGAGRIVGLCGLWLGHYLERLFLRLAHNRGFGATEVYARLKDNIEEIWGQDCVWCPSINVPRPVIQGIQTDFRKVLKYGRSVTSVVNDAYLS